MTKIEKINKLIEATCSRDINILGEDNCMTVRDFLSEWDQAEDNKNMDNVLNELLDRYADYID